MARRKRNSIALARAERRLESLRSINSRLDFDSGLTVEAYINDIDDLRFKLALYNTALSSLDKLADDVNDAEQAVLDRSEKMLLAVGSRYGRDSQEYEMAGGSRRKSRRRSTNSQTPTNTSSTLPVNTSTNGASANSAATSVS